MPSNIIKIKRSIEPGKIPTNLQLEIGELALNLNDRILYTKDHNNNVIQINNPYQGATGFIGATGIGFTGATGPQGVTGFTGATGTPGYVGSDGATGFQGATGFTGATGLIGATGAQGPAGSFGGASFDYIYDDFTIIGNPGSGKLRFNNLNFFSVTEMYINQTDANSVSVYNFLQSIDDSTSLIKGHFTISEKANPASYALFAITGTHTHGDSYFNVPSSYISGSMDNLSGNTEIVISFARTGDIGDTGPIGATGFTGATGPQGVIGYQGATGTPGYVGSDGATGFTGATGFIGATGFTGATGLTGSTGPVAGNNTQIIYNDSGIAAGATGFVYIKSTGNVGIGVSSPTQLLDVNGKVSIGAITDTVAQADVLTIRTGSAGGATAYINFLRASDSNWSAQFGFTQYGFGIRTDKDNYTAFTMTGTSAANAEKTFTFGPINGTVPATVVITNSGVNGAAAGTETTPLSLVHPSTSANSNSAIRFKSSDGVGNLLDYAKIVGLKETAFPANGNPTGGLGFFVTGNSTTFTQAVTIKSSGNFLIGTTTDGNFRLDVANSGSSGTARFYDQTATTGVTKLVVRSGAGQSTTALSEWQNSSGTVLSSISNDGRFAFSPGGVGVQPGNNNTLFITQASTANNEKMAAFYYTGPAKFLSLTSNVLLGWSNSTTDPLSTLDTAVARNSAGVLEINNGTAGTFRDLKLRTLKYENAETNTLTYPNLTTSQTAVDTNAIATYRSVKYIVQATYGSEYQTSEIMLIHNGTTADITEYGIVHTGSNPIVTFATDISGGNIRLLATAAAGSTTNLVIVKTLINI